MAVSALPFILFLGTWFSIPLYADKTNTEIRCDSTLGILGRAIQLIRKPERQIRSLILEAPDPKTREARISLLESGTVENLYQGTLGFVFPLRSQSGKIRWQKGYFPERITHDQNPSREALLGHQAFLAGVSPETHFNPQTGLIEIADLDAITWDKLAKNLSNEERIKLVRDLGEQIGRLHAIGIVHLDPKPTNILVLNDKGAPNRVRLIDFGFSLKIDELPEVHSRLVGDAYAGSPGYQGTNSKNGLPGISDDWEAFAKISNEITLPNARSPLLSALLTLYSHPCEQESIDSLPQEESQTLLEIATLPNTTPDQKHLFWKLFEKRLLIRAPNERLETLQALGPVQRGNLKDTLATLPKRWSEELLPLKLR